jgi:hypothetical protein
VVSSRRVGYFSFWSRGGRVVVGFAWFGWFCFWRASVSPFLSRILAHCCPKSQLYSSDIDGLVLNLSISGICGLYFWEKTSSQQ